MQVEVHDDDDFRTGRATVVPAGDVQIVSSSSPPSPTAKRENPIPAKNIRNSASQAANLVRQGTQKVTKASTSFLQQTVDTVKAIDKAGDKLILDGLATVGLDAEAAAAAAKIQAIYRGNVERAQVQGQLLFKRMAKTGQMFNINFLGSPVSNTIKSSLDVGSPPGASAFERARDFILAYMVRLSPFFLLISIIGGIGVVGFGLFLVILLFPVNFGVELGDLTTYIHPECNSSAYNTSLVLSHTKSNYPPRIIGVGLDIMDFGQKHYVQYECTMAQVWFNYCIK